MTQQPPQPNLLLFFLLYYTTIQAFDKESRLIFDRNVFYECSEYSGLEVAKFEDTLATLPSSALQPAPLPSILKSIKSNKKNTSRRVSVGVPVYYDYFSRHNNQDVKKYMADMSKSYRHTQHLAGKEMKRVRSKAVALAKSVIRFTGKQVLPAFLESLFDSCCDPATLEDLDVFTDACAELKNEMKHVATTIQCAFRVPPTASSAKLSLWKRLHQEKIKPVDEKKKIKSEAKSAIVVSKYRSFKPSIDSKKNRADRQTTLSNIRKNKKAANLAQRRGLTAVTSLPIIQIPSAPSAPIKKKRDSIITSELSRPIKLEPAFELVQFISILSECALSSIPEVTELSQAAAATTIQALIRGALTRSTREALLPTTKIEPEEIKVDTTTSSDSTTTELGQILPVEQEPEVEGTTTTGGLDDTFLFDDELSESHSSDDTSKTDEPRQLEQEAEADDDIDFGLADEPLDIPDATPEPIQSPKKLKCCRCKAVESSLDGQYWSVSSSRRRRKSSRARRQPDFFTPS